MRGLRGPEVLAASPVVGHLTSLCNSCLMPLVRTKPASLAHYDLTWPPQPNTMQLAVSLYQGRSVPSLLTYNAGLYKLISSWQWSTFASLPAWEGGNEKKNDKAEKVIWYLRWYPGKNGSKQSGKKYLSTAPSEFPFNASSSRKMVFIHGGFSRLLLQTNANKTRIPGIHLNTI